MYISNESPAETDERLRRVAAAASIKVRDGSWWLDEFALEEYPARVRGDAIALVRDAECWSQLVPVLPGDRPTERFRIWSTHFVDGLDNSGFVGWLASRIKAKTGSGIFVVCGQNSSRGGIYDHWGCPEEAAGTVIPEVLTVARESLRFDPTTLSAERSSRSARESDATNSMSLDGLRMRVVATAADGEVDTDTRFSFTQRGRTVWASYAGGAVSMGYLVGTFESGELIFRYAQVDARGEVHGGRSRCEVERLPHGRLRLREHFQWESRSGSGTNVLEEVTD